MSADYTTVELVENCKRRGFIPAGSGLTTSQILQILTEQLRNYIPAFLKGIREEYIIASLSIPITSPTVPLPRRAVGAALRTIFWTLSDGTLRTLVRIEPERQVNYQIPSGGEPFGYIFQGNNLTLVPPVSSGTIVVAYQQRPGQLVLPTSCALVAGYSTASALTVSGSIPTTIIAGAVCDIVSATPNFKLLAMDAVVLSVVGSVVTFTAPLPTDIVAGDYIAIANETPIAQTPYEVHDLLAQAAALEIAQSTGSSRLEAIRMGLTDLRAQVTMILSPRSDGSARPIVNRSRLGYGRGWW